MTAFLLRRPVLVAMLLTAGCLLGVVSYQRLTVELIPYAELPVHVVYVQALQESEPEQVEREAVIPLEGAIAGLRDVDRIESFVESRQATILVSYTPRSQARYAYLQLQERIAAESATLGGDYQAVVLKVDTEQLATQFMSVEARGVGGLDRIRQVVDRKVVPELSNVDGIANVTVYGGRQHSIEVHLDEEVLRGQGLSPSQVAGRLSASSRPRRHLGHVVDGSDLRPVSLLAEYGSLAQVEDTPLDGGLRLGDLATVVDGGAERETIARVNGLEAVSLALLRDRESNLLDLSATTADALERLNDALAADGVELVVQRDAAEPIRDNIGDIQELAWIGGLLAVAILWVFLRNLALVAVVALSIPVSVLIALNLFYALDISLNALTLVGIAIAIGMLIDNSIVVLEAIHRRLERGTGTREGTFAAVVAGVGDVGRAVVAATLTTICVFLPFVFSQNYLIRVLGQNVGVSIISTLLVSLAVALLLIPVSTYRLVAATGLATSFRAVSQRQRAVQVYSLFLKSCLRFPARTVIAAAVAFFVSLLVCLAVSVNAPQEVELDRFDLYARLPTGTTLPVADELAVEIDGRLARIEELDERRIGVRDDLLHLDLTLREDARDIDGRGPLQVRGHVQRRLRDTYRSLYFSTSPPGDNRFGDAGAGAGQAFQRLLGIGGGGERVVLRGSDLPLLRRVADDVRFNLERVPGVNWVRPPPSASDPEITLRVDHDAVARAGVTQAAIAGALSGFQTQLSSSARLRRGDDEVAVLLKTGEPEDRRIDDLRQLRVPRDAGAGGGSVALLQLADLSFTTGTNRIDRVNQEKEVAVSLSFESEIGASADLLRQARAAVDTVLAGMALPAGVSVEAEHDETDLSEFTFLIAASVVLIYMILASVFESLVAPLAMMITLPLATLGGLWGLTLTGNSVLNANALVGFMILLGVVVNNGIMLIDSARAQQRRGVRLARALLTAGQVRLRPILITALSTILAMLPLAMGKTEYVAVIGVPFAVAVIGGLLAGTVFTLILVPTVYAGLEVCVAWVAGLGWGARGAQLAALAVGGWLIAQHVDAALWQAVDATLLLGVVPALTWFVQSSLRRSQATLIPGDAPVRIEVSNLVKVFDEESRFRRQWRRGERQAARLPRSADASPLRWQLPLLAFHAYFTYLYLDSDAWILPFAIAFCIFLSAVVRAHLPAADAPGRVRRWLRGLYRVVYWLLPLPNLAWLHSRWDPVPPVVIVGILWYVGMMVHRAARRLYAGQVNVDNIEGRLRRSRRAGYRLVAALPLIGRRKRPFVALDQVSLSIESGMYGLIGPNGAGKTTLMRVICGILRGSRGKVRINGIDMDVKGEELQSLIGYLPQEFGTYDNMTAAQFLDYQALLKGQWDATERRRVVDAAIHAVHLDDSRDRRIKGFSGGMKQRVGIAQTLLHLPRILVVDEPTAGLDPRERIRFRNLLSELSRDRVVIFSTHIIEDISSSCNRLAVLAGGGVRFAGSPQEMVEGTRGVVWQATVTPQRYEALRADAWIVHHMRDGDAIRVRILAAECPAPEAETVTPTLEDAYLWLLEGPAA